MKPVICCQCAQAGWHAARGLCRACYARGDRSAKPDRYRGYKRAYRRKHGDRARELERASYWRRLEKVQAYRARTRDRAAAYARRYYETFKEYLTERGTAWRKRNLGRCAEKQARRRQRQSRFVRHLLPEHKQATVEFYAACPPGYEVDHVVPLAGKDVCGLHVHWNLQYLPRKANRQKSNKFEHDRPEQMLSAG